MLRKFGVAGLVATAAMGTLLMGSPAHASNGGDEEFTQEVRVERTQECGLEGAEGLIAINIPILSTQTVGDCTNSSADIDVSHDRSEGRESDEDNGY